MDTYNQIKKLLKGSLRGLVITYIEGEEEICIEYRAKGFEHRDQYEMAKAILKHLEANGLQARYNRDITCVYVQVGA